MFRAGARAAGLSVLTFLLLAGAAHDGLGATHPAGAAKAIVTPKAAAHAKGKHARKRKAAPTKDPRPSFQAFCQHWMERLEAIDPQSLINWETHGDEVSGKYVVYQPSYTCTVTDSNPPVGKIKYREVWYEKHGKSVADAKQSAPQPVETFDTTELFSYAKGKWWR